MNEDDTFRRLKRTTFEEVHQKSLQVYKVVNPSYSIEIMLKNVLEECFWTGGEYLAELEQGKWENYRNERN